jgi:serine/threonine protein phosphatase PrpC
MITCNPDVKPFPRSKEDEFILMGCDGIWEKYVEDTNGLISLVRQIMRKNDSKFKETLEELLDTLIAKETKEGVGCDNMTAILIAFH